MLDGDNPVAFTMALQFLTQERLLTLHMNPVGQTQLPFTSVAPVEEDTVEQSIMHAC